MRSEVKALIDSVTDEADCLDDLIDAVREQREFMRERDTEGVNELMDEIRDIFFDARTSDTKREDMCRRVAAMLMCEPNAGSLSDRMQNDERIIFNGAVDRLTQSVFVLKSEMMILTGLIDQHEKYTSMLLSEFQRLNGDRLAQSGGANFRG